MAKQYWIKIDGDVDGPYPASRIKEIVANLQTPRSAEISADGEKYHPISADRGLAAITTDEEESPASSSAPDRVKAAARQLEAKTKQLLSQTDAMKAEVKSRAADQIEKLRELSIEQSNAAKSFDVFLSYRRGGGAEIARLVKEKLERAGFSVFLDIEGLKEGSWVDALDERIQECTDLIPIITDGFFDQCRNKSDEAEKGDGGLFQEAEVSGAVRR